MNGTSAVRAYIGLGANLGRRAEALRSALEMLNQQPGVRVLRVSTFHETAAEGGPPGQPPYLNAAAELETTLSADGLLAAMLMIERRLGRTRTVRNAARTIDLDLLLFGSARIERDGLTIPHPRMWQRSFVMTPLREICPDETIRAMRDPPQPPRD